MKQVIKKEQELKFIGASSVSSSDFIGLENRGGTRCFVSRERFGSGNYHIRTKSSFTEGNGFGPNVGYPGVRELIEDNLALWDIFVFDSFEELMGWVLANNL